MNNWTITVAGEYFILKNTVSGETYFFLKKQTIIKPIYGSDEITFDSLCSNLFVKIVRTDMNTPGPQSNMDEFLDTLMGLLS